MIDVNYNILSIKNRTQLRQWYLKNSLKAKEFYVHCSHKSVVNDDILSYIDAVEVALCFGWVDSTVRKINNISMSRFSPRRKNSFWSELNKERCRRLIALGQMMPAGLKIMPKGLLDQPFIIPDYILKRLKEDPIVWRNFTQFPDLYKRIRTYNINFYFALSKQPQVGERMLQKLIITAKENKMYGNWNDNGKLLSY